MRQHRTRRAARRDNPLALLDRRLRLAQLAAFDAAEQAEAAQDAAAAELTATALDELAAAQAAQDAAELAARQAAAQLAQLAAAWRSFDGTVQLLTACAAALAHRQRLAAAHAAGLDARHQRRTLAQPPPPTRLALVRATLTAAPPPAGGVRAAA